MNIKRASSSAAVAAVAFHDYARPPFPHPKQQNEPRHEADDDDATADKADDEVDDSKSHAMPSAVRIKSSLDSLGMAISSKSLSRKEPLPMKLRALPRSFWEQPNTNQNPSPGYLFAPLPPLAREDNMPEGPGPNQSTGSSRSADASSGGGTGSGTLLDPLPTPGNGRGVVSPADTELLFSLFRAVENREPSKKVTTVRRGRPRRAGNLQSQQRQVRDDDPCLVSSVTEQLLPTLPGSRASNTPVLTMVSLRGGASSRQGNESLASRAQTVALPCLQLNSSYSQILSELVVKL